ncbi:hypothetical protein MAV100_15820 [Mycobacterium avium subsp. hominissuis 100]|nr:hypothetical protein O982_25220 [Mycobacterium avium 10-5581]KDP07104.1 hypothetical protein MAV100_15820 [Mycobacterium avium subsp. hominissuis 100]
MASWGLQVDNLHEAALVTRTKRGDEGGFGLSGV